MAAYDVGEGDLTSEDVDALDDPLWEGGEARSANGALLGDAPRLVGPAAGRN